MDVQLDLLLDGVSVGESVVCRADVDAAVVAAGRGVRDAQAADALRAVWHLATLLDGKYILDVTIRQIYLHPVWLLGDTFIRDSH